MSTWVVDVGGTSAKRRRGHVRPQASVELIDEAVSTIDTGPGFTPEALVDWLLSAPGVAEACTFVLGLPGPVEEGRLVQAPPNLGPGWLAFDFEAALPGAVHLVNDAALAARGHAAGRRLLYLGLGTGLGTAVLQADGCVLPLELGHLPFREGSFETTLGVAGLERLGPEGWSAALSEALPLLRRAAVAEDVVLGGGLAHRLTTLPDGVRRAAADAVFVGGLRLVAQAPTELPGPPALRQALRAAAVRAADAPAVVQLEDTADRTWLVRDGLALDLGRQGIPASGWDALLDLARSAGVEDLRDRMFAGEVINLTEARAVLHVALRAEAASGFTVGGRAVGDDVERVRTAMLAFADAVRVGDIHGAHGPFTDVIHIGIGGSDLGPRLVCSALRAHADGPRVHFVSNVDPAHLDAVLEGLDARRTLVVVASKTFTTQETMQNATRARAWLADHLPREELGNHLVALSAARDRTAAFGVRPERVFGFWDWVGGRYSLWSSIGLPIALRIGADGFRALLAGARAMDRHFQTAPLEANQPVLLALAGLWQRCIRQHTAYAIVPYAQDLALFPAWLQQLDMESNGKGVDRSGRLLRTPSGPVVFGLPGTDAQHAFFQLVHQGTEIVPVEFLLVADGPGEPAARSMLLANAVAQAAALLHGRPTDAPTSAHRSFAGSRPSATVLLDRLDPNRLGQLLALYEHRVFVQGAVLDLNSFDQFGVELGKEQARSLLPILDGERSSEHLDASTRRVIEQIRAWRTRT